MTNYEAIRNMSIEEMAEFLDNHVIRSCLHCSYRNEDGNCYDRNCKLGYKKWLESEVKK